MTSQRADFKTAFPIDTAKESQDVVLLLRASLTHQRQRILLENIGKVNPAEYGPFKRFPQ